MKKVYLLLTLLAFISNSHAQKVMLQGWYWDYPKTAKGKWWCDTLAQKASSISKAGFNYLWLPPMSMSSGGSNSNGYDISDLYDLGIIPLAPTGFGNMQRIPKMMDSLNKYNINTIADMIYNHRSGGLPEKNPSVQGWISNYNLAKHTSGEVCFPSDRFRCVLPIGGSTGRGAGNYYFKVKSASASPDYKGKPYRIYMYTRKKGYTGLADQTETANNGGGDCGEGNTAITLGRGILATIDDPTGCAVDEFALTLAATDFNAAGDSIIITLANSNSDYSDHFIYGIWCGPTSSDVAGSLFYQTYTDFTQPRSGRGQMNYKNFKPNGNPTCLCGDRDYPWFFNDYDQNVASTKDTLEVWSRWMMEQIGVKGFRVDAIKHFDPAFMGNMLDYMHYSGNDPKMVVGESYDYDAPVLKSRIDDVYNNMDAATKNAIVFSMFDFNIQAALRDACDAFGYDVRNVFGAGLVDNQGLNGRNAVTFVNNHDFRDGYNAVDNDPILAYAYILTNPTVGIPCVYYSDYYSKAHPTYTDKLNKLVNCHYKYFQGSTEKEYLNKFSTFFSGNFVSGSSSSSLIYQISSAQGGCLKDKDAVVAINFGGSPLKVYQHLNTGFPFDVSPGDTLVDVLGNSAQAFTVVDGGSQMYIELPARSYSVWAQQGLIHTPAISAGGSTTLCGGDAVTLKVNKTYACYDYQWQRDGVDVNGANDTVYTASLAGTYRVVVSYNDALPKYSGTISVQVHPGTPTVTYDTTMLTSSSAVSYQWYYGVDSLSADTINGATNQTYAPTKKGYYKVKITDADGCFNYSYFFYVSITGISDLAIGDNISIYPNPAENLIHVEATAGTESYKGVQLLNVTGHTVKEMNFTYPQRSFSISLDVSGLSQGLYFVRIEGSAGTWMSKVMKQ